MEALPARAALFDLGGVVIEWDPSAVYRENFAHCLDRVERFLAGPLTEIGLLSCQTPGPLAALVPPFQRKYPELTELFEFFASDWPRFVIGPMSESVALLERLRRAQVPLFGLTNWPEATFPPRGSEFEFLDWFEGIVVSGAEGMRKPDVAIFELTCRRFGLEPGRTVYIDDHAGNVASAQRYGLRAHHFIDPAGLGEFLRAEGLLA